MFQKLLAGALGLAVGLALAAPAAAAKRSYCYKVETTPASVGTHFERTQTRCDLVWMDREITIDEPLLTTGGSVVLFAETVRINAPIDTRPYFRTDKIFHDPVRDPPKIHEWSRVQDHVKQAFAAYYYWREIYDPQEKAYVFKVSPGHYGGWERTTLLRPYEAPQFPSARAGHMKIANGFGQRGGDGADAPPPSPDAVSSGDVLIVANKIVFCDACIAPRDDRALAPNVADQSDVERRRFIVTAGVKGGLGAPGVQIQCLTSWCMTKDVPNFSGRAGAGGDAGQVTIMTFGPDGSDDQALWSRLIDSAGGQPPFLGRLRTRSFEAQRVANRSEAAFARLAPDTPPPAAGEGATPTFVTRTTGELVVASLQTRLAALSLTRGYDPQAMMREIRSTPGVDEEVVLATDILPRQLVQLRRDAYQGILDRAEIRLGGSPGEPRPLPMASFISSLSCDTASPWLLTGDAGREIAALCTLKPVYASEAPERAYLALTGGAMTPAPSDFDPQRYDATALRERVQNLHTVLQSIEFETGEINQLLQEQKLRADTQLLETRLAEVKARIEELQRQAEGSGNPLGAAAPLIRAFAGRMLPVVGEVLTDLVAAQGEPNGAALRGLSDRSSSRATKALNALGTGMLPILQQLVNQDEGPDNSPQIHAARQEAERLVREIAKLHADAEARRETRLVEVKSSVRRLLEERRSLTQDYINSVGGFDALYKQAVLGASAQPTNASGHLRTNLAAVRSYLAAYGKDSIPTSFKVGLEACSASQASLLKLKLGQSYKATDCVTLRNDSPTKLAASVRHPQLGPLPIVVLDPGNTRTVSFKGLQVERSGSGKVRLTTEAAM